MRIDPAIQRFVEWAKSDNSIRALVLVGSRAIPGASVDAWSDYDLTLFVTNPDILAASDDWLNYIGEIMIQLPEKNEFGGREYPSRLIIYKDGPKIDFAIYGLEVPEAIIAEKSLPVWMQAGYEVLLDKDKLAQQLPEKPETRPTNNPPSESEYMAVINEFFWELIYLFKNLDRGELWLARYNESVLRQQLLSMLEWCEQSRHGWSYSTNYMGKGMKNWLSPDLYELGQKTFAGAELKEDHSAIEYMLRLFRLSAKEVGENLGYAYPEVLDRQIIPYINKCWTSD